MMFDRSNTLLSLAAPNLVMQAKQLSKGCQKIILPSVNLIPQFKTCSTLKVGTCTCTVC